jgi:hypothetical protein
MVWPCTRSRSCHCALCCTDSNFESGTEVHLQRGPNRKPHQGSDKVPKVGTVALVTEHLSTGHPTWAAGPTRSASAYPTIKTLDYSGDCPHPTTAICR